MKRDTCMSKTMTVLICINSVYKLNGNNFTCHTRGLELYHCVANTYFVKISVSQILRLFPLVRILRMQREILRYCTSHFYELKRIIARMSIVKNSPYNYLNKKVPYLTAATLDSVNTLALRHDARLKFE